MKKVAIVMGSASDLPVAEKATAILAELEVPFEVHVYSAHRTPAEAAEFAKNAKENGFGAIISVAGMAAHLGGVLASYTTLPVIGVPVKSSAFEGMDALLSTVQMPTGIPVATVAVGGGGNAALLACEMIALSDSGLDSRLTAKRKADADAVLAKNDEISASFCK